MVLPVRNVVKIEKKKFGLLQHSIRIEARDGSKVWMMTTPTHPKSLIFLLNIGCCRWS